MANFLNSYCETRLDDIEDFDFMSDSDLNSLLGDGRYPGMLHSDLSARLLMDMVRDVCFVLAARIFLCWQVVDVYYQIFKWKQLVVSSFVFDLVVHGCNFVSDMVPGALR